MNAGRIFGSLALATTLLAAPAAMAGERDHHRLGVQVDVSHNGHYDRGRHHRKDDRQYRHHRREAIHHGRQHRRAERRHHRYGHGYHRDQPRWRGHGYRQHRRHDHRDHGRRHHGRHHSSHDAELSIGAAMLGYIAGYSRYDD